jgi:Mitochondrial branched-chain alpha-ketoacid dehydrogenase kinase./Histidine kinase-, DNA gyrase B-, and HSP90-like ATPase.
MYCTFTCVLQEYSKKSQTRVSLQTLTRSARGEFLTKNASQARNTFSSKQQASPEVLMHSANFIRHEMPIRLARRIKDLDNVPYLKDMSSVQAVKDIYISSFLTLVREPLIDSNVREALFARKLDVLYERHSSVLVQMAKGAYELKDKIRQHQISELDTECFEHMNECHAFLDRFYISRIGIRVLAGHYLALRSRAMEGYVGLIYQYTSPYEIVKQAVADASYMCENRFGAFPEVKIQGRLDLTFAYIPTQLHYIVLELLKNAMRATCEHHGSNPRKWPPIEVVIADGQSNEDVVIKISDEGGGIPRSNRSKIWSYLFTTADPSIQDTLMKMGQAQPPVDHSVNAPLAGLGYGLPISKSYAKYFGGDVSLQSMEGYGSDAYIHLRRLGDSLEPLPM